MQSFPSDLLNGIREHLEKEKTKIEARILDLSKQDPFSDTARLSDNAASDVEASEESDHDRVSAMIDELKGNLNDINTALFNIANGTYGFCVECRNMIDTDRLKVLPTATLCQSCERKKGAHTH